MDAIVTMETNKKNIIEAIIGVMNDVGAIGKDSRNPQQGYQYRGVDAVMNALQPLFVKHGIFCAPEVINAEREERQNAKGTNLIYTTLTVRYTFYAMDGSSLEVVTIGEGMDSGDKSCSKALSTAYKYACFQLFSIPTEEMIDSEMESHEVKAKDTYDAKKELLVRQNTIKALSANKNIPMEEIEGHYKKKVEDMDITTCDKAIKALEAAPKREK